MNSLQLNINIVITRKCKEGKAFSLIIFKKKRKKEEKYSEIYVYIKWSHVKYSARISCRESSRLWYKNKSILISNRAAKAAAVEMWEKREKKISVLLQRYIVEEKIISVQGIASKQDEKEEKIYIRDIL